MDAGVFGTGQGLAVSLVCQTSSHSQWYYRPSEAHPPSGAEDVPGWIVHTQPLLGHHLVPLQDGTLVASPAAF